MEVIEQSRVPKRSSPASETFASEGITATRPTETCPRERIAAFCFLQVLWLIVIVTRPHQASPGFLSDPATIVRRQKVVGVEFPLESVSRAAATPVSRPATTSAGCPAEGRIQLRLLIDR
jgi:hypothetical protein